MVASLRSGSHSTGTTHPMFSLLETSIRSTLNIQLYNDVSRAGSDYINRHGNQVTLIWYGLVDSRASVTCNIPYGGVGPGTAFIFRKGGLSFYGGRSTYFVAVLQNAHKGYGVQYLYVCTPYRYTFNTWNMSFRLCSLEKKSVICSSVTVACCL